MRAPPRKSATRDVRRLLRTRDFRLVFTASLVSLVGDGVMLVALAFAVLDLARSPSDLGIVLGARTAAVLVCVLLAGVIADRVGRVRVMIAADLVRLVVQAATGVLLITHRATVAEMAISQALLGGSFAFFMPAAVGLMPEVAGDGLQAANALRGLTMAGANIIGPAIGGVLVVAIGPGAGLVLDAGTYGVSALLLARVRRRPPAASRTRHGFRAEMREGLREVSSRAWVWSMIAAAALVNTIGVAYPVLGALVAKQELGGAGAWAAILTSRAAGSMAAGCAAIWLMPRRPMRAAAWGLAVSAVPVLLLAGPAPMGLLVVAAAAGGFGMTAFQALWATTLQRQVPQRALSRVSSFDWFGSLALQPIGYALVGPLAAAIGVSGALYLCGALELIGICAVLAVRDVRTLTFMPSPAEAVE